VHNFGKKGMGIRRGRGLKCLLDYNNTLTSGAHIKYKFVILILLKMLNCMPHKSHLDLGWS